MLDKHTVEADEERLRQAVAMLPDAGRKRFYDAVRSEIRDPDTYAAANYAFLVGAHHFYLGHHGRGLIDVLVFLSAIALLLAGLHPAGVLLLVGLGVVELYSLFRSELIVQDFNNHAYERVLQRLQPSRGAVRPAPRDDRRTLS